MRTPCLAATCAVLWASTPIEKSQSTWTATDGQQPVYLCTIPASASFSSIVAAAAGCRNLPNRVPVSAYPQLGVSILKPSSNSKRWSRSMIYPVVGRQSSVVSGQLSVVSCSTNRITAVIALQLTMDPGQRTTDHAFRLFLRHRQRAERAGDGQRRQP